MSWLPSREKMSARSSARRERELLGIAVTVAVVLAGAGCGKSAAAPEGDPAKVTKLVKQMLTEVPVPGAARKCSYAELMGGLTMTKVTALKLAGSPVQKRPEHEEWVNPAELDSPAARELIGSDASLKRRAAGEFLLAPFYLIYHVDLVDEPLALGIKDFKRGNVGARALRYNRAGKLDCDYVFFWSNDADKKEWAVKKTDRPTVDPAVMEAMQQDLRAQMLIRIAALAAPPPPRPAGMPADDRYERN